MTYTYKCNTCSTQFEKDVDISSKSQYKRLKLMGFEGLPECPKCKSSDVKKVILPPTVIFKGQGFTKSTKGE